MAEIIDSKERCCCFTGHRPEKLIRSEREIRSDLEIEIRNAIDNGYTTFISGMSRGVDILAAEIVLQFRVAGVPVRLICAIPYENFERSWSTDWQQRYQTILNYADAVRYVCSHYCRGCHHIRNRWLIDHSTRVIAVCNGQPGGTASTVDYAIRQHKEVYQIRG